MTVYENPVKITFRTSPKDLEEREVLLVMEKRDRWQQLPGHLTQSLGIGSDCPTHRLLDEAMADV